MLKGVDKQDLYEAAGRPTDGSVVTDRFWEEQLAKMAAEFVEEGFIQEVCRTFVNRCCFVIRPASDRQQMVAAPFEF